LPDPTRLDPAIRDGPGVPRRAWPRRSGLARYPRPASPV